MRVLIHAIHYPIASARYAVDAFCSIGCDVRHIGQETGNQIWGMTVADKYIWNQEPPEDGWQPDLCVLMDTAYQWHHPTMPTVLWTVDNHVRNTRQPGISQYFLAHYDGHVQPVRKPDESWLPCGYDPALHTQSPIPYLDREYDVALIGVLYNHRRALVNELRAAGVKVLAGTGLLYEDYAAAYHNARISLCLSFNGDVAQRVFETAAMGNLVISDDCDDYPRLRPRGLHIAPQRFLVDRVRMFLSDPVHAQECIAESLDWVRPHTWDNRATQIIQWVEAQKAGEAFYATAE